MARWLLIWIVLLAPAPPTVTFVQPRYVMLVAGPRGVDIPVHAWVSRHPENRGFRLTLTGEGCWYRSERELHGLDSAAVQPNDQPTWVRIYAGECLLLAEVYGPGAKLRASARLVVTVKG